MHAQHAQSGVRQKEIIRAALDCFTELGFNETTMADICLRSNASNGSVYHHFKSKEQLASAVYLEGIREYQMGLLGDLEKEHRASRGISAMIRYHLNWVARNPAWSQFLFQRRHDSFLAVTEEAINTLNKEFAQRIWGWFARHIKAGSVRKLPLDIIIAVVLGPCQEYARLYLSGKAHTKMDEAVREMSRTAWAALVRRKIYSPSIKGGNYED
jgi:AcrR family transcriptional regulator